jgi:hypothetical protein
MIVLGARNGTWLLVLLEAFTMYRGYLREMVGAIITGNGDHIKR